MKKFSKSIASAIIVLTLVFATGCNGKVDDEKVMENVKNQLAADQAFPNVNAEVNEGVVTLSGTCEGADCAKMAENKISEADGVKSIINNIKSSDETDLTLRTTVQSIISKYAGVQADVAGGVIVLRGSIERSQVQPLMNELEALNPKKLDNQLAVQ